MKNHFNKTVIIKGLNDFKIICDNIIKNIDDIKNENFELIKLNIKIFDYQNIYKADNKGKRKKTFKADKYPDYEKLKKIAKKNVVYMIYTDNFPFKDRDDLENNLNKVSENSAFSRKNRDKKLSYDQKKNWDIVREGKPYCLYVGGSKDFQTRLKNHLGFASKDTYSLQLKEWWKKESEIKIKIWDLSNIIGTDLIQRQIIEDILWEKYQPLFGRKGAK